MRRILLIEDDPIDALLLQRTLTKLDPAVSLRVQHDGRQVLDALSQLDPSVEHDLHPEPDLILVDFKMPKISGLKVLHALKANERTKHIPVAMLTSSGQTEDISAAYDTGANSYLVKPNTSEGCTQLMIDVLSYWLGHNQLPDSAL